jgi:hypothetical protein
MTEEEKEEIMFEKQQILKEKAQTAVSKVYFINQIKNGLGVEIKKNPNQIKVIKKTRFQRFKSWFSVFFKKF